MIDRFFPYSISNQKWVHDIGIYFFVYIEEVNIYIRKSLGKNNFLCVRNGKQTEFFWIDRENMNCD